MAIIRYVLMAFAGYLLLLWLRKLLRLLLKSSSGTDSTQRESNFSSLDPYVILEVSPQASQEEIKQAYHQLMAQYHPDKVSHLGAELRDLANKKVREIGWAYKLLNKG